MAEMPHRKLEKPNVQLTVRCDNCHRPNHFATVCHSKAKPIQQHNDLQNEGAIFDTLCTTTSSAHKAGRGAIALDHHLYNHLRDQWVRKPSKSQPLLMLNTTVHPADYQALGLPSQTSPPPEASTNICYDRHRLPELSHEPASHTTPWLNQA